MMKTWLKYESVEDALNTINKKQKRFKLIRNFIAYPYLVLLIINRITYEYIDTHFSENGILTTDEHFVILINDITNVTYLLFLFVFLPILLIGVIIYSFRNMPAKVLILRPFDESFISKPLKKFVGINLHPIAHVYTLSDSTIKKKIGCLYFPLVGLFNFLIHNSFTNTNIYKTKHYKKFYRRINRRVRRNYTGNNMINLMNTIKVNPIIWKEILLKMDKDVDILIMDVSLIKPGLKWELEKIESKEIKSPVIFIARDNQFEKSNKIYKSVENKKVFLYNKKGKVIDQDMFNLELGKAMKAASFIHEK